MQYIVVEHSFCTRCCV